MIKPRVQLTLFVDENKSQEIEQIREKFNPEQYRLIKSHVTLCRDEELQEIEKVLINLSGLNHFYITIHFGQMIRFAEGKGVLMPATGVNEPFHQLRSFVLQGITNPLKKSAPHITLMHPRNSTCTDQAFEKISKTHTPCILVFNTISLIEQPPDCKWKTLKSFELKNPFG
ncbi:MAG: 2'-5' RNA ligase family protein [Ferruginibacter sp.]